ncbi:MAG: restriction endonuclease subunit S [bacterium]
MASEVRNFGELFADPTRNGLTRPKAVRGSGIKMVNMGELFAYPRLRNAPMDRVPLSDTETKKFLLANGDLLFARQSLVLEGAGKCSIFLHDAEPVTFESHITRVRLDPNKGDPQFYFYYLQSHHGRAAIRSIVEQGAGASGIRGSDLQALNVQWRPIEAQRAIAHILGTLDDKIELNRKMNETLEAMARAIFKSWFVDFDPVRAKAEGRDPDLPPHLAALFPDSFEDSELGEIPEGWRVQPYLNSVSVLGGGTPKTSIKEYWDGEIPWFSVVDAPNETEVFVINTEKKISNAGLENSSTQILPEGVTIITARGTVGKIALVGVPMAMNQSCYGLQDKSSKYGFYNYFAVRNLVSILQQQAHGSVFDTITRDTLSNVSVIVPPSKTIKKFEETVKTFFERIKGNIFQSRTLASIRDALLPKLLSGETRVKEAEKFVEVLNP